MLARDIKYVELLHNDLLLFQKTGQFKWVFRCPFCKDSKRSKIKKRGNIYLENGELRMNCFNCPAHYRKISDFIERVNPTLYREYVSESIEDGDFSHNKPTDDDYEDFVKKSQNILTPIDLATDNRCAPEYLTNIDALPGNHEAVQYLRKRCIPEQRYSLFYWTDEFKKFTHSISSKKFNNGIEDDYGRIIIPFFNREKKMYAFHGRSITDKEPKYFSVNVGNTLKARIFGMERINPKKQIYVVEGPFDSVFIPNCLAIAGSNFASEIVKEINQQHNLVAIMDNQPKNPEVIRNIARAIRVGLGIVLFNPTDNCKDINDMVMAGRTVDSIMEYIKTNTFHGFDAEMVLERWKGI